MKTRGTSGFTLVEVMIALAIVGLTATVLLEERINVVRDAGRARDMRTAWVLASQKMAELELDKTLWGGLGSQSNGDFGDVSPDYAPFQWDYQIVRETIDIVDPQVSAESKDSQKKRELYRLTMTVRTPAADEPIVLEAEFTIDPPKPQGGDASGDPNKPDSGGAPADAGGIKK